MDVLRWFEFARHDLGNRGKGRVIERSTDQGLLGDRHANRRRGRSEEGERSVGHDAVVLAAASVGVDVKSNDEADEGVVAVAAGDLDDRADRRR